MEMNLESLIEKIKTDGIDEADKESQEILKKAKEKAATIIKEAKNKAQEIIDKETKEAQKLRKNTEAALKQASRDIMLKIKEDIKASCDNMAKLSCNSTLNPDLVKDLIVKMVESWSKDKNQKLEVILGEEDKEKIEQMVLGGIDKHLKDGLDIVVGKNIQKGFRIGVKGSDTYYDLTDEGILEVLKGFLNPAIAKILNNG